MVKQEIMLIFFNLILVVVVIAVRGKIVVYSRKSTLGKIESAIVRSSIPFSK